MTAEVLQLLLTYCRYHRVPGHSDKERKAFDEKFIRLDTRRLCELTSAADRWLWTDTAQAHAHLAA